MSEQNDKEVYICGMPLEYWTVDDSTNYYLKRRAERSGKTRKVGWLGRMLDSTSKVLKGLQGRIG